MKSFLTIKQLRELLDTKEVSAAELVLYYHQRLAQYNPTLNAVLEVFDDTLVMEEQFGTGALAGIPGLLKDNICQKGRIASAASKILSNYRATYDATVAKRLRKEGAILLGRSNMDEFAMGSSGEFSAFGPTLNPWDTTRSPGGSSSGSAAAVASGLVPWALGTETGGSVRQPAAFCGLVGLYPTYGLFSRFGIIAFTSSTDQPGPLTKTVYDNALVTSVLAGHDPKDSTSLPEPKRDYTRKLNGELPEGIKIGVLKESLESEGIHDQVKTVFSQAVAHLERMGAHISHVTLPDLKYGNSVYFILSRSEAASNLTRYDGTLYGMREDGEKSLHEMYIKTRHDGFGAEVKRRILLGNYVLSSGHHEAYYKKAHKLRSMIRAEYDEAFKDVDLLLSPTAPTLPFKLGKESADPLAMYLADYFTVPNCITGLPALSLPCGFSSEGLPIGFQFMGPRLSEELIFKTAYAYEQSTEYHLKVPKGYT